MNKPETVASPNLNPDSPPPAPKLNLRKIRLFLIFIPFLFIILALPFILYSALTRHRTPTKASTGQNYGVFPWSNGGPMVAWTNDVSRLTTFCNGSSCWQYDDANYKWNFEGRPNDISNNSFWLNSPVAPDGTRPWSNGGPTVAWTNMVKHISYICSGNWCWEFDNAKDNNTGGWVSDTPIQLDPNSQYFRENRVPYNPWKDIGDPGNAHPPDGTLLWSNGGPTSAWTSSGVGDNLYITALCKNNWCWEFQDSSGTWPVDTVWDMSGKTSIPTGTFFSSIPPKISQISAAPDGTLPWSNGGPVVAWEGISTAPNPANLDNAITICNKSATVQQDDRKNTHCWEIDRQGELLGQNDLYISGSMWDKVYSSTGYLASLVPPPSPLSNSSPMPTSMPVSTPTPIPASPPPISPATPTPVPAPVGEVAPVIITKSLLPQGKVSQNYTISLIAQDRNSSDTLSMNIVISPTGIGNFVKNCSQSSPTIGGIKIAQIVCFFSGKPVKAGSYMVSVTVKDNYGATDKKILTLSIVN